MRTLCLSLVFGAALVGAMVVPGAENSAQAQIIIVAPPEPIVEPVPVAPYRGAVWTPGYHRWQRGRYVWVGGHYVRARPGFRYVWRRSLSGA